MFYASPVVIAGRVFIGSTSGRFYALDADTGALIWSYPPLPQPPLIGSCGSVGDVQAFGAYGILSSASPYKNTIIFLAFVNIRDGRAPRGGGKLRCLPGRAGHAQMPPSMTAATKVALSALCRSTCIRASASPG
jgi:outer membrane protein assembly factor BamB